MNIKLCLLTLLIPLLGISAKEPRVFVHYIQLQNEKDQGVFYTVFAVDGESLSPTKLTNGQWQSTLQIELSFKKDDSIFFSDAMRINSPIAKDSSSLKSTFLHQSRYALPKGKYELKMKLFDVNHPKNFQELTADLLMRVESDSLLISEPIFSKTTSNQETEPIIPVGDYLLPKELNQFQFYYEVYNSSKISSDRLIAKYYLIDKAGKIMSNYAGYQRLEPESINTVSGAMDITQLPRGIYYFHMEVLDSKGKVRDASQTFLYRKSDVIPEVDFSNFQYKSVSHWLTNVKSLDSLHFLVDILYPISNPSARLQQERIIDNGTEEQHKKYLSAFWDENRPANVNSEQAFRSYLDEVEKVDNVYGARVMPGYRTDRGRSYLQYGPPDLIEDRKYEPSMYPYEIWQYNRLSSASSTEQVNRIFVFANTESAGDLYRIIHSNAEGEFFNNRWMLVLNRRVTPQMDIDETGSDFIQNGSRVNSNMIINGASMDRLNRR